ncbi:MAG: hypothetical protein KDA92_23435, partial [Planctomycetales bacterium]|nr:hypothetical protein [Planctomycetales bacterium]
ATYDALLPLLEKYRELFKRGGPIQAIISGNRPFHKVSSNPDRLAYIDGRLGDLDQPGTADWMPLISDRWGAHFKWNGEGDLPIDERQKIVTLVEKAHSQGRRVRFWAIPDKPQAWRTLHALGVDLINTDHLAELADELQKLGN